MKKHGTKIEYCVGKKIFGYPWTKKTDASERKVVDVIGGLKNIRRFREIISSLVPADTCSKSQDSSNTFQ
jgi:hypothetical protein